jgi:ribosomal protein L40E
MKKRKVEPPIVPPQVVVRHAEVCHRCGAENSFRKTCGPRNFGVVVQAYARCRNCGALAHIRDEKAAGL